MPLGRAFTMRSKRAETKSKDHTVPSKSQAHPSFGSRRSEFAVTKKLVISSPVQLLSSTNSLSYDAPDLNLHQQSTSLDDRPSSSDESDNSNVSHSSGETLTDASSIDDSPVNSPKPSNAREFLQSASPSAMRRRSSVPDLLEHKATKVESLVPKLPQRSPSHSKQAHQLLARQKSMQHIRNASSSSVSTGLSRGLSMASRMSREQRESLDFFKGNMDPSHPFNNELQQLHEVAEELTTTVRDVESTEDQHKMQELGLAKFQADDYLSEIQPLYVSLFGQHMPEPVMWI